MLIGAHIQIDGMSCLGCSAAIKMALQDTAGVNSADVDLEQGKASVLYEEKQTNPEKLCGIINRLGYKAQLAQNQ